MFVGRRDLTATIHAARDRAAARGSVETVLLGGEPGAGKTSIASAIARVAHGHDWTVLFGSCDELVTTPYEPFREAIGEYVSCAPMSVLADHVARHGGEIGRLTPNLSARVGGLPLTEAEDPETSRRLLFEAVADLVRRAARRPTGPVRARRHPVGGPQHAAAHPSTRERTRRGTPRPPRHLSLDRGGRPRLRIACSPSSVGFPQSLTSRSRVSTTTALVDLLEAGAGHSLAEEGQDVASYLLDETDGNALFAVELVRHLVETDVLAPDAEGRWHAQADLADIEVPRSVRAVLRTRVGRLDPEAQRALAVASVAGREFDSGRDRGRARARRARRARPDRSGGAGVVGP